jgi:hypothetical protein
MAGHFSMDRATIKSIPDRELGLRKFTRRWMPHIRSTEQKLRRVAESQNLLTVLAHFSEKSFQEIIRGDESWFTYLIESEAMFTSSPVEMTATVRPSISCKKVIITLVPRQTAD